MLSAFGSDFGVHEQLREIRATLMPNDLQQSRRLIDYLRELRGGSWSVSVRDTESIDIDFDRMQPEDLVEEEVNIVIGKPDGDTLYFFTSASFAKEIAEVSLECYRRIYVFSEDEFTFSTQTTRFSSWDGIPVADIQPDQEIGVAGISEDIDPRRVMVRDMLGGAKIVSSVGAWLLVGKEGRGRIWEIWRTTAVSKLILLFGKEVWMEEGMIKVSLSHPRKLTFYVDFEKVNEDRCFGLISEAVRWLCTPVRDAEAKHEMLSRRIGEACPNGESSWPALISNVLLDALDGARVDYRSFVNNKSSESLKSISELRKNVREEVYKITDKAQSLTNSFIAAMVFLCLSLGIRLTMISGKAIQVWESIGFCLIILLVSVSALWLQRNLAIKSIKNELKHHRRWHRRSTQILSRSEYKSLAVDPVWDALRLFRKNLKLTTYGFLIASVVFFCMATTPTLFSSDDTENLCNNNNIATDRKYTLKFGPILGDDASVIGSDSFCSLEIKK